MIENELVDVIIESGATCNLMSEQVFDKVYQGKLEFFCFFFYSFIYNTNTYTTYVTYNTIPYLQYQQY